MSQNLWNLELSGDIQISPGARIDPDVILGYPSGRELRTNALVIGCNARIRSGSVIYEGTHIGDDFETGHNVIIREETVIGNGVRIWANSVVDYGCQIGNRVKIHANCYVAQYAVIEDDVFLAPGVTLANEKYPGLSAEVVLEGPTIRRAAQIGVNTTILPGVLIGEGAFIGAGSVVTRDVPARMIAYGNPARVKRPVESLAGEVEALLARHASTHRK